MPKGVKTLLVGLALVLVLFVGSAQSHNGPATPANMWEGGHWWSYNGCSWSADWPFKHACIHHDGCYGNHWASRATCDSWFLKDMRRSREVIRLNLVEKAICYTSAQAYYAGVRKFGGPAYLGFKITIPWR